MANRNERIQFLEKRLNAIIENQKKVKTIVGEIQAEISALKGESYVAPAPKKEPVFSKPLAASTPKPAATETAPYTPVKEEGVPVRQPKKSFFDNIDFEKFVGENLISKIGILVLVIGVIIGAKYSFDNNLISPLTRIVLGYALGVAVLFTGLKLKKNYLNYSSVLVSGAMLIMFFITFAAYDFYALIPSVLAYGLMVIFAAFTVFAAVVYDKQVIAHLGLVGAYSVPFFIGGEDATGFGFLTYIAIINLGILAVSFYKYWRWLFYGAFVATWFIFAVHHAFSYSKESMYAAKMILSTVYFVQFYIAFLAFKVGKNEQFSNLDIVFLLLNAFIYFLLGINIIQEWTDNTLTQGLFSAGNAAVHFTVAGFLKQKRGANRPLYFTVVALVLAFCVITIPILLSGTYIALAWLAIAVALLYVGKREQVPFYHYLSYIVLVLAFVVQLGNFSNGVNFYAADTQLEQIRQFQFVELLMQLLFTAGILFACYLQLRMKPAFAEQKRLMHSIFDFVLPIMAFISVYLTVMYQVEHYYNAIYHTTAADVNDTGDSYSYLKNSDNFRFIGVWGSIVFFVLAAIANRLVSKYIFNSKIVFVYFALSILLVALFSVGGLQELKTLRNHHMSGHPDGFATTSFHLIIRYILLGAFGIYLLTFNQLRKSNFLDENIQKVGEIVLHFFILWYASTELMHWLEVFGILTSDKLGLSIFWGLYALMLVSLGIWKKNKWLRIAGIVLFGVTLVKLFFYDIVHLNTIAKTIVFISLGLLLLLVSFLYNKYNVSDEE